MVLKFQNPNWHYNQILSEFNLKYSKRLEDKNSNISAKRKNFIKCIDSYKLDDNNRLCILNNNFIKSK